MAHVTERMSAAEYLKRAPSEHLEQSLLIERCRREEYRYPELALLVAIPNAGKRSRYTGNEMKREGLSPGFPDLALFAKSRDYAALFIELKTAIGKVSDEQHDWITRLNEQGYYACVCRGQEQAYKTILWYLGYRDSVE